MSTPRLIEGMSPMTMIDNHSQGHEVSKVNCKYVLGEKLQED